MPSLDQLKDKDKFNGSDDPESIPFATFLGLLTARCVQQDIGHVLVDTDPNQRTRRLVDRRCVLHFLRPEIGVFSATLGPGRSYCPVGSDASTESDQNGLWIAALTHTRHPYRGCSSCAISLTLTSSDRYRAYRMSPTSRISFMSSSARFLEVSDRRHRERKRRPRRDRHRGDIGAMHLRARSRGF